MRVAHKGDGIDHGGIILDGSPDTFCDGVEVARVGDNALCDIHGPVTIISGASTTKTNGKETAREFDLLSCGGMIVRNIEDGEGNGITVTYNGASYKFAEEDLAAAESEESDNRSYVYVHPGQQITPEQTQKNKTISAKKNKEIADLETSKPLASDNTIAKSTASTTPVECSMFTSTIDYNLQISKHLKLRDVTIGVALATPSRELTEQWEYPIPNICCNLKALATNVVDLLIDKYGRKDVIITTGFRRSKGLNKSGLVSQHELGQAVDIQFPGQWNGSLSTDAWWERVLWIKDNIPYDQFLVEYMGGRPWCHLSFNSKGSTRGQNVKVMTFLTDSDHRVGLVNKYATTKSWT
jgi:uncharacterized Zn-binding protein involved in type VI secretion